MRPCFIHASFTWYTPPLPGTCPRCSGFLVGSILGAITKEIEGSDRMQTSSRCSHPSFPDSSIPIALHQQSWDRDGELFHFLFPKGICMTSVSGDSLLGHLILGPLNQHLSWAGCAHLPPPVKQTCLVEKIPSVWRNRWASGSFLPVKSALPFGSPRRVPFSTPLVISQEGSSILEFPGSHLIALLTDNLIYPGAERPVVWSYT